MNVLQESSIITLMREMEEACQDECRQKELLIPLMHEVKIALTKEKYEDALDLLDEVEEVMDREFC